MNLVGSKEIEKWETIHLSKINFHLVDKKFFYSYLLSDLDLRSCRTNFICHKEKVYLTNMYREKVSIDEK